jgi:hypothetical protein
MNRGHVGLASANACSRLVLKISDKWLEAQINHVISPRDGEITWLFQPAN